MLAGVRQENLWLNFAFKAELEEWQIILLELENAKPTIDDCS
jgi:hypothetical protein